MRLFSFLTPALLDQIDGWLLKHKSSTGATATLKHNKNRYQKVEKTRTKREIPPKVLNKIRKIFSDYDSGHKGYLAYSDLHANLVSAFSE